VENLSFGNESLLPTKVFAKAGLDNQTSPMCKHQRQSGLDVQFSALVNNFNTIFLNGHLYRAGQSMNSLPSQILERCVQFLNNPNDKN
jgi:hypothetical protein